MRCETNSMHFHGACAPSAGLLPACLPALAPSWRANDRAKRCDRGQSLSVIRVRKSRIVTDRPVDAAAALARTVLGSAGWHWLSASSADGDLMKTSRKPCWSPGLAMHASAGLVTLEHTAHTKVAAPVGDLQAIGFEGCPCSTAVTPHQNAARSL